METGISSSKYTLGAHGVHQNVGNDLHFDVRVRHFTDGYLNNPIPVRDVSLDLVEQTIEIVEENEKFYLMVFAIADIISGEVNNLIATDIASRGLAIEDITHVINFQFRNIEEYSCCCCCNSLL
ncbi:uncharacterized protein LOC142235569 [Haematobia irritans]|uniref:uncharacterized protein LOC142235569 n=1 Tax=Haematobia irritans TaxID=7368 RepID=UPI003F506853